MIEQGFVLMGAGMGVVGLFLTVMVVVMYGTSAFLRKFDKEPVRKTPSGGGNKDGGDDAEIAVAIAAVRARTRG